MKAVILAAGYATRLYPLTENQPKCLLNVGDKPIVEHITDKLQGIKEVNEIFLITNHKFYPMFKEWSEEYRSQKKLTILNDGTLRNEDRLGAIGDLNFVIKEEEIHEDILLIAGDNLFGFSLKDFLKFFKEKNSSVVAFCDLKKKDRVAGRFGVGILDETQTLIDFEEKPLQPRSTLAATCCYLLTKKDQEKVAEYLKESKRWDNPGDFIKWLLKKSKLHGFVFQEHWFDIGSFEGLEEASKFYENLKKK